MIAGPVAGGKTTLAFQLAVARANTGAPVNVLGRRVEPAPPGMNIVLIEGEVDEVATAKKLRRTCALLGVGEDALERIIWVARKGVRVGDATWVDIEQMISAGTVSDIFLDTIARVAPGESNSEEAQAAIFDSIAQSVEMAPVPEKKPVVWALAHTRKGGGSGLDDVLGSVQRTAQIDSAIIVDPTRDASGKVISVKATFAKLRHDPEEHPAPVVVAVTKTGIEVNGVHGRAPARWQHEGRARKMGHARGQRRERGIALRASAGARGAWLGRAAHYSARERPCHGDRRACAPAGVLARA